MFDVPRVAGSVPEGESDDSPIVLEGISSADFKALLKVLYPKCVQFPTIYFLAR